MVIITLCTDLNITVLPAITREEGSTYSCVATGYPNIQLTTWQTGLGADVPQSQYSNVFESFEYRSVVSSFLIVASDTSCRNSRGYRCTFSKGGLLPFTKSGIVHCLPGNKAMHGLCCAYVRELIEKLDAL